MITREGIARAVATMYAPEPNELDWLEEVRRSVKVAFDGHLDAQAMTLELNEKQVSFRNIAGEPLHIDLMKALFEVAEREDLENSFLSGPVVRVTQVVQRSKTEAFREVWGRNMSAAHALDVVGIMGMDPTGIGCCLTFVLPKRNLSPATRSVFSKLSSHLTTAYRLRHNVQRLAASLTTNGEVCDLQDPTAEEFLPQLRKAALAIDRANREAEYRPDTALSTWKALVEGRWSLVTRFRADGRKLLIAHENPPQTRALTALTRQEQLVLSLIAVGHPAKVVAYELGYAESTVSLHLKSALQKLGFRNRQELIEVHGVFFGRDVVPREITAD